MIEPPRPIVPTISRLSSGKSSSSCLRRSESGLGPTPPVSAKASLKGSRRPWAAYSKVSNCCITGSGSSGGAGRARTLATHSSRLGASPGVLVIPRPHPARPSAIAEASMTRATLLILCMSAPSPGLRRLGGLLFGGLLLVQVAVGLDRAGEFEVGSRPDRAAVARLQRDVVHGHDDHPRQRGHAADEGAELVVAAAHAQRDRLLGVELLRRFRPGAEQVVLDAGGDRGLRDVGDQVRHFGAAGKLAQHLLELLLHLRKLLLERLQVGRPPLLLLELRALLRLLPLQSLELAELVADEEPPQQAEDQQPDQDAEPDLVLARPRAHVVEVELAQRHLAFGAHDAAPSSLAGSAATSVAASVPAASPASTSSPAPSSDGLDRVTDRLNTYGSAALCRPAPSALASITDSLGLAIQPAPSRLRM